MWLPTPVLLDEWQEVPGVLGAVKRAVDEGSGAGRFLLTGSVRADLETQTWPGTGRVVRVQMYGLTVREMVGELTAEPFLDRLARADGWATSSGALPRRGRPAHRAAAERAHLRATHLRDLVLAEVL